MHILATQRNLLLNLACIVSLAYVTSADPTGKSEEAEGGLAWKSPRKLIGDDLEGGDTLTSSKMRRLRKQRLIEIDGLYSDSTNSNRLARMYGFSPHRTVLQYENDDTTVADNVDDELSNDEVVVNDFETFFDDEIRAEIISEYQGTEGTEDGNALYGGDTGKDNTTDDEYHDKTIIFDTGDTPRTVGSTHEYMKPHVEVGILHADVDLYTSFIKIPLLNITDYKGGHVMELSDLATFEVDPVEGEIVALYAKFVKTPARFENTEGIKRRNLLQIENNSSNHIDVIGSIAEDQVKPLMNVPRNEAEVMNYVGVIVAVLSSLATIIGLCLHRKMTFVTVNHHHQNEVKSTSQEETQPLKKTHLKVDAFL